MPFICVQECDAEAPAKACSAARRLSDHKPVIVMIHGFNYDYRHHTHCPKNKLFADRRLREDSSSYSWPLGLRLTGPKGLGIGWAWQARGSIWQAHARTQETAQALARMIMALKAETPARPVHLFAHSLGARVALNTSRLLPANTLSRLLLLNPAAHRQDARHLNHRQTTEVVNITSTDNWYYDALFACAFAHRGRLLASGLPATTRGITLNLGDPAQRAHLHGFGFRLSAPQARICHASPYNMRDRWRLYRNLMGTGTDAPLPLGHLMVPTNPGPHEQWACKGSVSPAA